jgi:flagellar biosynthesis/type III secretory pathway protein FliH
MTHFKPGIPGVTDIKNEGKQAGEIRVVKLETGDAPKVKAFALSQLHQAGRGDYQTTKSKYGALAATDEDRHARSPRDARFSINPLLRDPLSVETEERRVIDQRVSQRIEELSGQARSEGAEKGYQDGLKKGHAEAFAKFQEEGSARLTQFEELLKSFENIKTDMFKANERFLIETIFRISKMVMLKELSTDREYLLRLCTELIQRVGLKDHITVRISPQDQQTIEMLREQLSKSMDEMKNLQFEVSDQIVDGGCAIETQWNAIDASVETQLKGIYDSLVGTTSGVGSTQA